MPSARSSSPTRRSVRLEHSHFDRSRPCLRREGQRHPHLVVRGFHAEIEKRAALPFRLDEPFENSGRVPPSAIDEQSAIGSGLGSNEGPCLEGSPLRSTGGQLLVVQRARIHGLSRRSRLLFFEAW